jgi:single-strand DNA-binding protein
MASLNRVIMTGTIEEAPSTGYTKDKDIFSTFVVLVTPIKRENFAIDTPERFHCIAYKGLATVCAEYLTKGSLVAIEGKMSIKNKNKKSQFTEIIVENLLMLDKKFYNKG